MSSAEDYSKLTVVELKRECTELALSTKGTKSQLVNRLTEYITGKEAVVAEITDEPDDTEGMDVDVKKELGEEEGSQDSFQDAARSMESEVATKEEPVGEEEGDGKEETGEYGTTEIEEDGVKQEAGDAENEGEEGAENDGEDEAENGEEEGAEKEEEDEKAEENKIRPLLTRGKFVFMYGAINALKTVLIKPFKPEFFCAEFKQWVEQAVEYQINRDRAGCSAAVLYFDNTDVSDAAFQSLKAAFESPDVEVYHPPLTSKVASQAHEWFSQLFDFKLENDYTHRMVTLENLPESVTETVIKEKFPEAFNIIFYGHEGPNKGIGTMELPSEEKVQSVVGEKLEVEIEGEQVLLHRLNTRINKWHKELKYGAIKMVKTPAAELEREAKQIKEMSDEDRIEKCKRYQEAMKLKDTAKNRADISSAEIIKVHEEYSQEMKILSLSMMNDTDRRFKDTGTFPEPEDIMLPYTTQVHTAKLTRGDKEQKRQEKKKQYNKDERRRGDDKKGWSPGSKGHKRSNSSSYNKGGPPHKKSNSSYDSGYHGGDRKGGYSKGGKGGRDYDDRSRRGYQGGRDRPRDRDRGSGSFGNVTSKMENAIMSLAEKMSHLEKLQLGTSGMGNMGAYGGQGGSGYMGGMQDSGYGRHEGGYGGGYNSGSYNSGGGSRGGGGGYNRNQKYFGGGGGGGNRY